MPFKTRTIMTSREELVKLSIKNNSNKSELCKRFGISRTTGYKWLRRFESDGVDGLRDKSKRPRHSPNKTPEKIEELVLSLRDKHPAWGAMKISKRLENLGHTDLPSVSTTHEILKRHGRIDESRADKHKAWKRFEKDTPNESWQMDFKGHFKTGCGRCHPLTVIDDCSRYLIGLQACANERRETVKERLIVIFQKYGLPDTIVIDNGPPWAVPASRDEYTRLGVWLIRLGVRLRRIGAYHPQSNGKVERLHRTLKAEVLQGRRFRNIDECQNEFDRWKHVYNYERPHEAIDLKVPSERYRMSMRSYPAELFVPEYGPDDEIRKVQKGGRIDFRGKKFKVGQAFTGLHVAVRPTVNDGIYNVVCIRQKIKVINMKNSGTPRGVPE